MDEITQVMESVVKVEIECKEEPESEFCEDEKWEETNESVPHLAVLNQSDDNKGKDEVDSEEEIKPPLMVFVQSTDNGDEDDDKDVGKLDSEEDVNPLYDANLHVEEKEEIGKEEENQAQEDIAASASFCNSKQLWDKLKCFEKDYLVAMQKQESLRIEAGPAYKTKDFVLRKIAAIMGLQNSFNDDDFNGVVSSLTNEIPSEPNDGLPVLEVDSVVELESESHDDVKESGGNPSGADTVEDRAAFTPSMLRKRKHGALGTSRMFRRRPTMSQLPVKVSAPDQKFRSRVGARTGVIQQQKLLRKHEREKKERETHELEIKIKQQTLKLLENKNNLVELEIKLKEKELLK